MITEIKHDGISIVKEMFKIVVKLRRTNRALQYTSTFSLQLSDVQNRS